MTDERLQALEQRITELERVVKELSGRMLTKDDWDPLIQAAVKAIKDQERRDNLTRYGNPYGPTRR